MCHLYLHFHKSTSCNNHFVNYWSSCSSPISWWYFPHSYWYFKKFKYPITEVLEVSHLVAVVMFWWNFTFSVPIFFQFVPIFSSSNTGNHSFIVFLRKELFRLILDSSFPMLCSFNFISPRTYQKSFQ